MARTGQPSRERVATLGRSLAILDALAEGGELGTNELARRVGTTASTVSRQLGTLVEAGLVEHVAANGRYRLGIRLVELANTVLQRLDVRMVARPHLEVVVDEPRRDGDALRARRSRRRDRRLRAGRSSYVQGNTTVGRPSVGSRDGGGER